MKKCFKTPPKPIWKAKSKKQKKIGFFFRKNFLSFFPKMNQKKNSTQNPLKRMQNYLFHFVPNMGAAGGGSDWRLLGRTQFTRVQMSCRNSNYGIKLRIKYQCMSHDMVHFRKKKLRKNFRKKNSSMVHRWKNASKHP